MTTAQVEAWVGARKGSINEVARGIDASFADAALGRMMLHRRRAVAASVISKFFARVGSGYAPYLENRAPTAPLDPAGERAIAARAGQLVASFCGAPPPLLFERALLAEADGRIGDALSDFEQVLAAYPGFVAAAVAAGRLALAAGNPAEAIRSLAPVEGEVEHTRDGAALLADAARAIGLHESASRYDLAALVCRGGYDSHGNDCAPIDLTGKIADDERMPQILYLEGQPDDSVICNAGGIYYRANPLVGRLLSVIYRGDALSMVRSLGPGRSTHQTHAIAEIFKATSARLRLLLRDRFPNASLLAWKYLAIVWCWLRRLVKAVFGLIASIAVALVVFLYRRYRRLPVPVRRWANEIVQFPMKIVQFPMRLLRPLLRNPIASRLGPRGKWRTFSQISEPNARGQLAAIRYQSGLARIFSPRPFDGDRDATARTAGSPGRFANAAHAARSLGTGAPQMPAPGTLPPSAEKVLRQLVSATDIGPPSSAQS